MGYYSGIKIMIIHTDSTMDKFQNNYAEKMEARLKKVLHDSIYQYIKF